MNAGDDLPVPESLGMLNTTLKPIPVNDPGLKRVIGDDMPGIAGVAVVLMEQDDWPDHLATAGYSAFVNAITFAVAKVAASFQHATHAPTKDEINAQIQPVKDTASTMVHDAVLGAMSGAEKVWFATLGNNDDTIGSEIFIVTHDDLAEDPVIEFERRWSGDNGDWQIDGSFIGVVPCLADALAGLLARQAGDLGASTAPALQAMRSFADNEFATIPGLDRWWQALQQATPGLARCVDREPETRRAVADLFAALPAILAAPDTPMERGPIAAAEALMKHLARCGTRADRELARRSLAVLRLVQGSSWNAALRRLAPV